MKRVSVTDLKNQLSRYLRLVKKGETVEILERSVPIARLEAVRTGADAHVDAHLERLRRDGIVIAARAEARAGLLEEPPVPCRGDPSAAVIDGRGDR